MKNKKKESQKRPEDREEPPKPDRSMERLASEVEQTNPEFVEHLRQKGLLAGKKAKKS